MEVKENVLLCDAEEFLKIMKELNHNFSVIIFTPRNKWSEIADFKTYWQKRDDE